MPITARLNEEIRRTHEAMATMARHPIIAPIKTAIALSYEMLSVPH
jgi:hypothetical protein